MSRLTLLGCLALLVFARVAAWAETSPITPWTPHVLKLATESAHAWDSFPVSATFAHSESGETLAIDAYWDGKMSWCVRFAPTKPGKWTWRTDSHDPNLDGQSGVVECCVPQLHELEANPNLRGQVGTTHGSRIFTYADGTPFLGLAEEFWDFNVSSWMPLEEVDNYLKNRRAKRFNIVQIRYCRVHAPNEGGHAFPKNTGDEPGNGDFSTLNPAYFQALDERFEKCFELGFVVAGHPLWIGVDTKISLEDAQHLQRYLLARYGAYNIIWSLSGEFDKNFHKKHRAQSWVLGTWNNGMSKNDATDCGPWRKLGAYVAEHNPYKVPISVHPGWHNPAVSSSGDYLHDQGWFDHSWIQTFKDLYALPGEVGEDYSRQPVKPIFFAEGIREGDQTDAIDVGAYGNRWEAWQAHLNGAAIHTYRHFGVYMDKWHVQEKCGPLKENLETLGSTHAGIARDVLKGLPWSELEPAREQVRVDGRMPPLPKANTRKELDKAVMLAAAPGEAYVLYIPKNNKRRQIEIDDVEGGPFSATWVNPRTGESAPVDNGRPVEVKVDGSWRVPSTPDAMDWVVVLTPA